MENKNDFWLNWSQNWSYGFNRLSNIIGRKLIDAGIKMTYPYPPYGVDPYDELGYDKVEDTRFPKLKMLESGERDARENFGERMQNRNRFTVYGNNMIKKRFKVTEQQSGIREKGRLRTSGKTFNQNIRRNPNFTDIIIP